MTGLFPTPASCSFFSMSSDLSSRLCLNDWLGQLPPHWEM